MFYAFIKLLAGTAGRGIPLVIFILETGGRGLASLPGIGFLAAAVYSISLGDTQMAPARLLQRQQYAPRRLRHPLAAWPLGPACFQLAKSNT